VYIYFVFEYFGRQGNLIYTACYTDVNIAFAQSCSKALLQARITRMITTGTSKCLVRNMLEDVYSCLCCLYEYVFFGSNFWPLELLSLPQRNRDQVVIYLVNALISLLVKSILSNEEFFDKEFCR
jgi:hypothetical protein